MCDVTPGPVEKTRGLLVRAFPIVLLLAGLPWLAAGCRKKESPQGAASSQSAGQAAPQPTVTPDPGEAPSLRQIAETGEGPFSAVKSPFEARVDDRERVWILDAPNSRIRLFDANGGYLGGWGGNGDGKTNFKYPEGLATTRDGLYVADTWNHRVERFSLTGDWKGSVTGFMGPRGVAVGPDGSVWVADTGNNRVVKYDASLQNQQVIGEAGSKPGEFKGPVSIAIAPSGTVYVTDPGNGRIQVLDKAGKPVASWSVPWIEKSWLAHLETDQNGTLYASHPEGPEVFSFSKSGAPDQHWTTDDSGQKFVRPVGIAIDRKKGTMYVMDAGARKVLTVSLSGRKGR